MAGIRLTTAGIARWHEDVAHEYRYGPKSLLRSISDPQKRALEYLVQQPYEDWMSFRNSRINPIILRKLEERGLVESWSRGPRVKWMITSAGKSIASELSYQKNIVRFKAAKNA